MANVIELPSRRPRVDPTHGRPPLARASTASRHMTRGSVWLAPLLAPATDLPSRRRDRRIYICPPDRHPPARREVPGVACPVGPPPLRSHPYTVRSGLRSKQQRTPPATRSTESPVAPCTAKAGTPVARRGSRCRGPPLFISQLALRSAARRPGICWPRARWLATCAAVQVQPRRLCRLRR